MRRREFLTLAAGAAAAWPLIAHAQSAPVVGMLMDVLEDSPESRARVAAFRQALADLGWKEGQNIHLEYRWSAGKSELIRQYAEELIALPSTVILANGTPAVVALKNATSSIPIVCALVQDPVGLGLIKSLSHPGGNITGFTFTNPELIGKWIDLLKDVMPGISRAALIFDPKATPFFNNFIHDIEASRQPGETDLIALPLGTAEHPETAIHALAKQPGSGLIIPPDPFNVDHLKQIAELAGEDRLPTVSVYRQFAVDGGLMAYGPDTRDIFRRAAGYIDRILKGARAADLAVQQLTKFDFVINLKTAKALGLTVPPTLLALADEVIE